MVVRPTKFALVEGVGAVLFYHASNHGKWADVARAGVVKDEECRQKESQEPIVDELHADPIRN